MIDRQSSRSIDSLRVACCAIVVASHVYEFATGRLDNPWNEVISYLAVAVFFFLSGYVNQISYSEKPGYGSFLAARAKRLLPVYYAAAGVSLAFAAGFGVMHQTDWLNLVFFQSIVVPTIQTNGPLWSLAWEMVLYLCFPLVLGAIMRPLIYAPALLGLLILFQHHQILLIAFLAGVAAAHYGFKFPRFVLIPSAGRWTYEIYCCHYPLLFLAFSLPALLP